MFMSITLGTFRYTCALVLGLVFNALLFTTLWRVTATTFTPNAVVATRIEFTHLRKDPETINSHENAIPKAEMSGVPPLPRLDLTITTVAPAVLPWMTPAIDMPDLRAAFRNVGNTSDYAVSAESDAVAMIRIPPRYPRPARLARIQGYVTMEVGIGPDGTVIEVSVVDAAPPRMFDIAAIDAIKRWKFRPRIVNGVAVGQRVHQTIEFRIEEG